MAQRRLSRRDRRIRQERRAMIPALCLFALGAVIFAAPFALCFFLPDHYNVLVYGRTFH